MTTDSAESENVGGAAATDVQAEKAGDLLASVLGGEVREVLRAVQNTSVEELRLTWGGVRIALQRDIVVADVAAPPDSVPIVAGIDSLPAPQRTEVLSHMVGPFHRSREPDGPMLVAEGEHVDAGRALGVIETLGMGAEVEAPASGRLERVLVEDGQAVEYGQVLAIIVAEDDPDST